MKIVEFFKTSDGRIAKLYSLRNQSGFGVDVTNAGGALVGLFTPDRNGQLFDVLIGFGNPADYEKNQQFFGALVGRVANRISGGKFTLDGKEYTLLLNDQKRPNTLHGGKSWAQRFWEATAIDDSTLALRLHSPDGDAGFPGAVDITVIYQVTENNELLIDYTANSDRPTVVGMTNHAYFNLSGIFAQDCLAHRIRISADSRTEVNKNKAPTGNIVSVAGTPYDLTFGKSFGEIFADFAKGLDDNYILSEVDGVMKRDAVIVSSSASGIEMRVSTTAPGIQFYMGRANDLSAICKDMKNYRQCGAFCLEAQHWPDAVNHPNFPSMRIEPGKPYKQTTIYRFGVVK
ncbi:MAG: galactose mutarotase [Victivallales bacterium]|jgi:aldose 1-epimerase|nr:galactose mutarotase [Victivallales bacterium]